MSVLASRAGRILRGQSVHKLGTHAFGERPVNTAGDAHEIKGCEALINESALDPMEIKGFLANRRDDADAIRADSEERGAIAIIPTKANRRAQIAIDEAIHTTISVIIPTHNDFDVLPRAIDSVLSQSYEHFEIVIVDDASEQEVGGPISAKYQDEQRLRIHRHPVNKMLGGARNSGIEIATGDFIFFLDADDKLLPKALERLVSIAVARNADIVQGGSVRGNAEGRLEPYHAADFISDGGIDGLEHFAEHRFASVAWNKLYRRAFLISSGIRFTEGYMHEDVAFAAQAAFLAKSIVSVPDPVIQYVSNANSLTRRPPNRANIESYLATYSDLLRVMTGFGLAQDTHRALALRVLHAHGSSDFGPKLIDCYSKMGPELFESEFLSVAREQFGGNGLAAGDLIVFFLGQIARHNSSQARTWLLKRAHVVWQALSRAFGNLPTAMSRN